VVPTPCGHHLTDRIQPSLMLARTGIGGGYGIWPSPGRQGRYKDR
jgi:hypothetical protein